MRVKRKSKREWFVGRWHASNQQIAVTFVIELAAKGFRVQAIDESDGEKLVVSKVRWNGKDLSFETRTPSNQWRTKNRLQLISKRKMLQELTYWESLEKLAPSSPKKGAGKESN
jgi:hypothetical protein